MTEGTRAPLLVVERALRALPTAELDSTMRHVLLVLAGHADARDWTAYPEQSTLALATGRSRSTVALAIIRLRDAGFIRCTSRPRSTSTLYTIVADRFAAEPSTGARGVVLPSDNLQSDNRPSDNRTPDMGCPVAGHGLSDSRTRSSQEQINDHPKDPPSPLRLTPPGEAGRAGSKAKAVRKAKPKSGEAPEQKASDRYADAYAAGVRRASGLPFSAPRRAARDLVLLATTHARGDDGGPLVGAELLEWFEATAAAYRRATADKAEFQSGFAPHRCLAWMNAGRPQARGRGKVQPPAEGGEVWTPAWAVGGES